MLQCADRLWDLKAKDTPPTSRPELRSSFERSLISRKIDCGLDEGGGSVGVGSHPMRRLERLLWRRGMYPLILYVRTKESDLRDDRHRKRIPGSPAEGSLSSIRREDSPRLWAYQLGKDSQSFRPVTGENAHVGVQHA